MTLQTPVILGRDEGAHFHFLDNLFTLKVDGERSGGAVTVMEFLAPRGFGPPLHRHDREDELFHVLAGEVRFVCDDVDQVAGVGSTVWLPRQVAHQFQILSQTARVLQVTTPAQFERFVASLGEPTDSPTLPEPAEVDAARVAQVAADFGIEILGPPPPPLP